MAQTQAGAFDRFNDALRTLDDQFQELRERLDGRRQQLTADVRDLTKTAETRLRKSDFFRRADRLRQDIEAGVDRTYTQVLETIGLASKSDVEKLSKKLNTLSKKLNDLAKDAR